VAADAALSNGGGASAWAQALADVLLPEGVSVGQPVRLDCDDEAIAAVAGRLGIPRADAVAEFVACLRREQLVDRQTGVRPVAGVVAGRPPGYLLGLAALVLAASRMASDELGSMAAYYRRLSELLGIPLQPNWPQIRGVPELVQRFDDLATWMDGPERGQRGVLDLPNDVHPSIVGVPIHQSLLRAGDRTSLGPFFERTSRLIDAGWDPVHQLTCWSGRHQLTVSLQAILDRPDLHAAIAGALRAARHSWDGSTVDATGRRLLPSQLTLHLPPLPFTLSVTVPALPTALAATAPDGSEIVLSSQTAAVVREAWLAAAADGPVIADAGSERVRLLPGPTMLFEITPLGVQSVAAAAEEPVWVLTCDEALIAACEESRRFHAPLPAGWVLLCDIEPDVLADGLRASRDDEERTLAGVRTVGGLRLASEVWLLDHPPNITADLPEPVPVTLDGISYGEIEPQQVIALDRIAHQPGMHSIEIGEQELTIELAARGQRAGVGSLAFDLDERRVYAGPTSEGAAADRSAAGPLISPPPACEAARSLIVRYRSTVDVIDIDGTVRNLAPPVPAAWLNHVGLPEDGPWEIPEADQVVWVCVDIPGRKFVIAHQAADVPVTDDVLSIVEWHADTQRIVDRSDGRAEQRWQRLTAAVDEVS